MNASNVSSQLQSSGRIWANPMEPDRFVKQFEPSVEVVGGEATLLVNDGVFSERVAHITLRPKQSSTPELSELWDVFYPVDLGYIFEQRSKQVVLGLSLIHI